MWLFQSRVSSTSLISLPPPPPLSSPQGLSTIRAFGAEPIFQQRLFSSLDFNGRPFFVWLAASRWLAFRLDSLVAFVVLAASLLAVALRSSLPPALVALSLSYTLQLSGLLQWAVRQGAEVENLVR